MQQEEKNYLFVHFTGESSEGEQIYFSVSRDGLHWQDLNNGKPVIKSCMGEMGVRDPFILRSQLDGCFYIIGTDLRIANEKGWAVAQEQGSMNMLIWQSKDLIHWSEPWSFQVDIPGAGCVWAPEAIYDSEEKAYLVIWASKVMEPGESVRKHRIYCSYTQDFAEFTKPQKYIERSHDVIDTTIIEEDGVFYRFSKDETTKNIRMDCGRHLQGEFQEIVSESLNSIMGVEGPIAFPMQEKGIWCLMADQFAEGLGYLPLICKDLKEGIFQKAEPEQYDMGENKKRHGSILVLSEEEYERVLKYWGNAALKPLIPGLFADPDVIKYKGKYYLYPTTDGYNNWSGTQFHAFSSDNLRDWKDEGIILDVAAEQVPWAVGCAWAPTIFEREGRFYYYFCAKRADGVSCIGVAVSDSPVHGFKAEANPLITPEILKANGIRMSQTIDPSIYEENGEVYLLFGNGSAAIVKLSEDLLHIHPETMKNLEGTYDFREAITVLKKKGIYHFTWSCDDTGSEDYHVNYGISESLYGPIQFQYPVLEKNPDLDILGTGHHCIFKEPGEEKYYIVYHRFGTPLSKYTEGKGFHRELCLDKIEFNDKGLLQPVKAGRSLI